MAYILIDAGNSCLKLSVVEHTSYTEQYFTILDYANLYEDFIDQLSEFVISHVVVSNVNNSMVSHIICDASLFLWQVEPTIVISEQNKYGISTLYTNPRLLGSDRWLALIAAFSSTPKALCVIDCGSAVTIDVLTDKGLHLGGFITPGLNMSRTTLGLNTSNLPQITTESAHLNNSSTFLASNTYDAIIAGSLYQLSAYVEHIITEIKNTISENIECIITGGDAIIVQKLVTHHLVYREKLVLDGLNIVAKDLISRNIL